MCSAVVVVVFGVLAARVAQLQLMSGNRYTNLAVAQSLRTIPLSGERGSIFDRNGRDLALSIERSTIYADPVLVVDPGSEATTLAPLLRVPRAELLRRLTDKGTPAHPNRFAYLAHTVPDDVALVIRRLSLPGIGSVPESARSYPGGSLAGALLGHVGADGQGLDGIEYLYRDLLQGRPGQLVVEQDPHGHDIPNTQRTRVDAHRGTDLVLTLDEDVQWETEASLLDQVAATQAKSGMAVVVDVTTGDVLSMATVRGATKTSPARVALPGEHNAPLTDLFEPGSTSKVITLSWAIEHGLVGPDTRFTVPYSIRVDPAVKPYFDAEYHPAEQWTTSDILRESSNVGTIEIAQRMHNRDIADALAHFGLGRSTAVPWPGEPNGLLLPASQYFASGKYSSAIGYGAAVTGMQMLDVFTTIANGGTTRPPRLLGATVDANGVRHDEPLAVGARVVSSSTAATMTHMLEGVVWNGTGACAAIPGYPVAGKTGTSKKALPQGGYSPRATMASFIGFAPADHPRFAAIVVLDEPQNQYGGAAAAPVFSEVMQFALTQYQVPPTDTANVQYTAARAAAQAAGNSCVVPHGSALASILAANAARAAHSGAPAGHGNATPVGSGTTADSLEPTSKTSN